MGSPGSRPRCWPRLRRAGQGRLGGVSSLALLLAATLITASCGKRSGTPAARGEDLQVTTRGSVEVTARLVEIPEGAIFQRELYDYATILKYELLKVHRGEIKGDTFYVGHYNPWKPRRDAPDRRVKDVGGNLRQFQAGQVHRLALEAPIEDHFMGGIVNQYFGRDTGVIYWAIWSNLAREW